MPDIAKYAAHSGWTFFSENLVRRSIARRGNGAEHCESCNVVQVTIILAFQIARDWLALGAIWKIDSSTWADPDDPMPCIAWSSMCVTHSKVKASLSYDIPHSKSNASGLLVLIAADNCLLLCWPLESIVQSLLQSCMSTNMRLPSSYYDDLGSVIGIFKANMHIASFPSFAPYSGAIAWEQGLLDWVSGIHFIHFKYTYKLYYRTLYCMDEMFISTPAITQRDRLFKNSGQS